MFRSSGATRSGWSHANDGAASRITCTEHRRAIIRVKLAVEGVLCPNNQLPASAESMQELFLRRRERVLVIVSAWAAAHDLSVAHRSPGNTQGAAARRLQPPTLSMMMFASVPYA